MPFLRLLYFVVSVLLRADQQIEISWMRFTIGGLLFFTLCAALGTQSWVRWRSVSASRSELQSLQAQIVGQGVDDRYFESHTLVCQRAIEANPLPSPFFTAAKQQYARLFPSGPANEK